MNILSVDWDFFFPCLDEYDWGMNEEKFFYYELIWHIRWSNIGLKNKKRASDHIFPDPIMTHLFWKRTLIRSDPKLIVITDSHKDIEHILKPGCHVYNFDAHHDCGYKKIDLEGALSAGNWGLKLNGIIEKFIQVYPEWRLHTPESAPLIRRPLIQYTYPEMMPKFDTVFICRSSCWTPSWCDPEFLIFISELEKMFPQQYKHGIKLKYAVQPRPFDIESAKSYERQINEFTSKNEKGVGK